MFFLGRIGKKSVRNAARATLEGDFPNVWQELTDFAMYRRDAFLDGKSHFDEARRSRGRCRSHRPPFDVADAIWRGTGRWSYPSVAMREGGKRETHKKKHSWYSKSEIRWKTWRRRWAKDKRRRGDSRQTKIMETRSDGHKRRKQTEGQIGRKIGREMRRRTQNKPKKK